MAGEKIILTLQYCYLYAKNNNLLLWRLSLYFALVQIWAYWHHRFHKIYLYFAYLIVGYLLAYL